MILKNLIMNSRELKLLNHLLLMKKMYFQEINYSYYQIIKVNLNLKEKSFMEHLEYIYFFDISIRYIKELNWHIKLVRILNKMINLKVLYIHFDFRIE